MQVLLRIHALSWVGLHYNDVILNASASQITSLTIVYSTVYSGIYERTHQSSASLAFVRGIHRGPRKMLPFDDVIMNEITTQMFHPQAYRVYRAAKNNTKPDFSTVLSERCGNRRLY